MSDANLAALLITTEANFRYFTGFRSQHWVMPTRPMFFVLPAAGEPVAIIPSGSRFNMRASSWVKEVRTWMAPQPGDDGVSLLIEALREAAGPTGRIGAEFGPELQLRMPINDFLRVREAIRPLDMVDGSAVTRRLRMLKSPAEVARIRAADDEKRARRGSPMERSSSAIGCRPSTRVAPPGRPVVPSDAVVHSVRRRTPSRKE